LSKGEQEDLNKSKEIEKKELRKKTKKKQKKN
jgi:hypothetical protein